MGATGGTPGAAGYAPGSVARIGIVGFPNTGKTTLFNALTGLGAYTAPHPFATTEPNVGIARVPDPLLDQAARVEGSAKTVHATLDLLDLPAMARAGEGLGAQFLGRLREMDALAVVLRAFEDESVPSEVGGSDPVAQAEELLVEFALADFEVFERRSEKIALRLDHAIDGAALRHEARREGGGQQRQREGLPF